MFSSSSGEDSSGAETWIEWFVRQDGNDFFCEVDRRYIEDNFNLFGLREEIGPNFKKCLDIILDRYDADQFNPEDGIEKSVQDLYGLIHARFLLTKRGQDKMLRKFRDREFGVCPLQGCEANPVLPVGLLDEIDVHGVKVYCPRCNQVMMPSIKTGGDDPDLELDGAYFGTTFPHLLLMQYPELIPPPPEPTPVYVPRVFGFRVRRPGDPRLDRSDNKKSNQTGNATANANSEGKPSDDVSMPDKNRSSGSIPIAAVATTTVPMEEK